MVCCSKLRSVVFINFTAWVRVSNERVNMKMLRKINTIIILAEFQNISLWVCLVTPSFFIT